MLTVKEAVRAAQEWVTEVYSENEVPHLRLEEVELSSDERFWMITLGWEAVPGWREDATPFGSFGIQKLPRVYKKLMVDAESGEVKSMKIREVA